MLYFENDYCEGAHPAILQKLTETNFEKVSGYGTDPYCASAKEKIRTACACPEAVCSGALEMTAPAVDGELNVTLPSLKAERLTERYENAGTADKPKYEWRKVYSGALGSRKIVGEARLGAFVLAPELLETLPTPAFCQEFDGGELARAGLEMYGKLLGSERYLSRSKVNVRGALRFSYRISNLGGRQVTVKAIQKDGVLHPAPDQAPCVLEGILSREEVLKDSEENGIMGLVTGGVIAALLLAAGVVTFRRG